MKLSISDLYNINIYERYKDLKTSERTEYDNYDLAKIFEYYSCIKLSEKYGKDFYEYNDIDPTFKENNKMSQNDTGIDCCDLDSTIVQCKLRKDCLGWSECGTFFGSQNIYDDNEKKIIIRWNNMILARNECNLTTHLIQRKNNNMFNDVVFNKKELIDYCENLLVNKPIYPTPPCNFLLRDYQKECINLIQNCGNVVISLPTGTGKNTVIVYSLQEKTKYLILVPRIILMEQLNMEIITHRPKWRNKIQLIGDGNAIYNKSKNITICVFNSISVVEKYVSTYHKIFIDEAHHIYKPSIYTDNEEEETKKSYVDVIKELSVYDNNVCLSATIDKMKNFEYYFKDIREMIDLGYLCDYTIHIPIFSNKTSNKDVCRHLIGNYRNIIIYCSKQEEGLSINKLMNEYMNGCSQYIDCYTPKNKRNKILEEYKSGNLPFLVNVKVLVEGFDAPITKGVCFIHLTNSKTTLIQIIGRALRKHSTKTMASVILPFSTDNDEKSINKFMRIMTDNDVRIMKSYRSKKLGGYINIKHDNNNKKDINQLSQFRFTKIYDGIYAPHDYWNKMLDDCQIYINKYGKKPIFYGKNETDEIKILGRWLDYQKKTSKKDNKWNQEKKDAWNIFYTKNNILINEKWYVRLNELIQYVNINQQLPNGNEFSLYMWYYKNLNKYKKPDNIWDSNKMKAWENFMNKYKIIFIKVDAWFIKLNNLKKFVDINNRRPYLNCNDEDESSMNIWVNAQIAKYKSQDSFSKDKNQAIEELLFMYSAYFKSEEEIWVDKLNEIDKYIMVNKKRPAKCKNKDVNQMNSWLDYQLNRRENKFFTSNTLVLFEQFKEKHKLLFNPSTSKWLYTYNQIISYIKINKQLPFNKKERKKMQKWINKQKKSYNNLDNKWTIEQREKWLYLMKKHQKYELHKKQKYKL